MSKLKIIVFVVFFSYLFYQSIPVEYNRPALASERTNIEEINSVAFNTLFESKRTYESLAEPNHYTIIEGYLPTCSICKKLEAQFPAFLKERTDVVIRQVQFQSRGGQNFNANSPEEYERQIREYGNQLAQYSNFAIDISNDTLNIDTCGTPHIEIYGPNQKLLIGDSCKDGSKDGWQFLEQWIEDEL